MKIITINHEKYCGIKIIRKDCKNPALPKAIKLYRGDSPQMKRSLV